MAASRLGEGAVGLTWSPASDPDSGIGGYRIYRDALLVGESTGTTWYDVELASPAADVSYEVAAFNVDDALGPKSPVASLSSLTVDTLEVLDDHQLEVVFTKTVDETSAETLANYGLVAGEGTVLGLSNADLQVDGVTVRLTLSGSLVDGSGHALSVSDVEAQDGTPIAPGVRRGFHYGTPQFGTILREYWLGISGNYVSYLTSDPDYPDNPDGRDWATSFEGPTDWANSYGTRMCGWLVPEVTDDYTFWIASDDNSELWLSTDDDPDNKVKIAYVDAWTGSRQWYDSDAYPSDPIPLVAGQWYYIEALQKEGGGGDNLAVAWTRPGESPSVPIPGQYLVPAASDPLPDAVVSVEATDPEAAEDGTDPGRFTLARTGSTEGDLLVYYTLTGSAESADYDPVADYVTILAGEESVTVDVTPVDDGDNEGDETVVLNLAPGTLYNVGAAAAVATILDNEFPRIVAAGAGGIVLNPLDGRTVRTISQTEPSGLGVETVRITFSEVVLFADDAVIVQKVHFEGGAETIDYTFGAGEVTVDGFGTAVMTITIDEAYTNAVDTWVKVTLSDDDALLADAQGHALDGEPRLNASGLGYLYDAADDLPTGNGLEGGEAVFYVGSLRGDLGGYLFGPPDRTVDYWDLPAFTDTYQATSLDADFGGYLFGPPDKKVDYWDLPAFTDAYQVTEGLSLSPLPTEGTQSAGAPVGVTLGASGGGGGADASTAIASSETALLTSDQEGAAGGGAIDDGGTATGGDDWTGAAMGATGAAPASRT
ncbi:MAG: PA14 domain-containing protein, partial [Planctomycetota bacterium]|nr:PA14 domain-containing protein [Planctomycetota bacterium]